MLHLWLCVRVATGAHHHVSCTRDLIVEAQLAAASGCTGKQAWSCVVPPDPADVGLVEVTFSVDRVLWHSYTPATMFQFVPEVVCDLDGPPDFPAGCTVGMLADPACNPECNVRRCAHDNRACPTAAVVVAVDGDDAADGFEASPVRTLSRAVTLACSGFIQCLPVLMKPGNYSCDAAAVVARGRWLSIAALDPAQPPYLGACHNHTSEPWLLTMNTTKLELQHVTLDGGLRALRGSVVVIRNSTLLRRATTLFEDSAVELAGVAVAGASSAIDFKGSRLSELRYHYETSALYVCVCVLCASWLVTHSRWVSATARCVCTRWTTTC